MNFLAHSYLTFTDEQIVGQFLQDFIRNSERFSFPAAIGEGITLHRAIDTFTDAHEEVSEAKKIFSPLVRLYAGAFVDVAFDYFLARSIGDRQLYLHSQNVYRVLRKHQHIFPPDFLRMLHAMEKDNWLYQYKEESGIRFSFRNVLRKAKYLDENLAVFGVFLHNKPALEEHFNRFFPDLLQHVSQLNDSFRS
ncbi:ACP phosphodiesterase [Chryseobacterium sp. 6424]|uniref:acyl carrier protein phosphodiesterase n=1 Tax=Chryseobacterium sp. 6424 TaxID=2039166 RepID=UPI000EFB4C7D|nr:ACP phosphodiesterase [Chryseobacterium sp. 6424]AYO56901.1 ACP phosphodiesterase [Chryseobacterium sp. 6424]